MRNGNLWQLYRGKSAQPSPLLTTLVQCSTACLASRTASANASSFLGQGATRAEQLAFGVVALDFGGKGFGHERAVCPKGVKIESKPCNN
jgi:hypothetical protein